MYDIKERLEKVMGHSLVFSQFFQLSALVFSLYIILKAETRMLNTASVPATAFSIVHVCVCIICLVR